jgi:competence protein ComK
MQITSNYRINENTLALLPAKKLEYGTTVIEMYRNVRVRKTPLQLIKATCYDHWCTYEGRRHAVIHHTKFKKKVPIPINTAKGIYFFPTHSTKSHENHWLSHQHIVEIATCTTYPENTLVEFENGVKVSLNVSVYVLKKQMQRTFECMYKSRVFMGRE